LIEPGVALDATILIAAAASCLTSLELIAVRNEFRTGGLLDSRVLSHGRYFVRTVAPPIRWAPGIALAHLAVIVGLLVSWPMPWLHDVFLVQRS